MINGIGNDSKQITGTRPNSNVSEIGKSIAKSLANIKAKIAQKIAGRNTTKAKTVEKPMKKENKTVVTIHDVKCPESLQKLCAVDEEVAEQLIR